MSVGNPVANSLAQARYEALAKGWPALYLALTADILAVAAVHAPYAPWWAWLPLPAILVPKALIWAYLWYRDRNAVPSPEECARSARRLGIEVSIWIALIVGWQMFLSQWGTPETLLLLSLCLGGQMVYLLFGLLHLRAASVISAAFCVVGLLFIASRIGSAFTGIVILLGGGVIGLAYVAHRYYHDFTDVVTSQLTLRKKAAKILALSEDNFRIANTDMLTEIGNRRAFFRHLHTAIDEAKANDACFALGILDLDGFKTVNDSNGHLVGDRLLRAMAERLGARLEGKGDVYRLGGDEFAFLLKGIRDEAQLLAIGDDLIATAAMPFQIGDLRVVVGASVGFATYPDAATDATDIYDRADFALFHGKKTGRLKTVVFSQEHERAVRDTAVIDNAMRAADLDKEFFLTFQPIVDSRTDTTPLFECLARWESPTLGLVSPGKFIVVAEQTGFISTLTPVLLRKALSAIRKWGPDVGISFNLSGHDIAAPEKILKLISIVEESGVSPSRIEFEVTETALMMNLEQALASIHLLKNMGSRISLDDFGTGYSSLSQIQKLPLDKIKVDGSFVRDLANSEASQKIVRSVSALSRDLSLACVVEGVETQEQLDILQDIGCRLIQGYFYAKPMREEQVADFLDQQQDRRMSA